MTLRGWHATRISASVEFKLKQVKSSTALYDTVYRPSEKRAETHAGRVCTSTSDSIAKMGQTDATLVLCSHRHGRGQRNNDQTPSVRFVADLLYNRSNQWSLIVINSHIPADCYTNTRTVAAASCTSR